MDDAAAPTRTPVQDLILEVLVARVTRLGEPFWPFDRKPAITRALRALEAEGLVSVEYNNVPGSWRVWLTDAGAASHIDPGYRTPAERRQDGD